jgi:hypothetical protein
MPRRGLEASDHPIKADALEAIITDDCCPSLGAMKTMAAEQSRSAEAMPYLSDVRRARPHRSTRLAVQST